MIAQSLNDWILKKDKNNIQIFTQSVEESNVVKYKILATVDAPVADVAALLYDVESYPEWTPSLKTTEILSQITIDEMYYYIDVNAPWPISNRDNIIHFLWHEDTLTKIVKINLYGVPNYIDQKDGIVRVTRSEGSWQLRPKTKYKTEIVSIHSSDPSGKLPAWIVKIFIVNNIYNLFINLKEEVKKEKYKVLLPGI